MTKNRADFQSTAPPLLAKQHHNEHDQCAADAKDTLRTLLSQQQYCRQKKHPLYGCDCLSKTTNKNVSAAYTLN